MGALFDSVADGQTWDGVRCEVCARVRMSGLENRDGVVRCQDRQTCSEVAKARREAASSYDDLIEAGWKPAALTPEGVVLGAEDELVALREAVALLTLWQNDAREALGAVKDHMDEYAYDELATILFDGVSDHMGEPYVAAERVAREGVVLSSRQRAALAVERAAHEGLRAAVEALTADLERKSRICNVGNTTTISADLRAALAAGVRGE